jgi:hypothetical protein
MPEAGSGRKTSNSSTVPKEFMTALLVKEAFLVHTQRFVKLLNCFVQNILSLPRLIFHWNTMPVMPYRLTGARQLSI